jgi:hypothetical protein
MFQPIRAIARALLVPATLTVVALTSPSAASAGALPASHLWTPRSAAVAAAHWVTPGSAAVALGAPTSRQGHFVVKW